MRALEGGRLREGKVESKAEFVRRLRMLRVFDAGIVDAFDAAICHDEVRVSCQGDAVSMLQSLVVSRCVKPWRAWSGARGGIGGQRPYIRRPHGSTSGNVGPGRYLGTGVHPASRGGRGDGVHGGNVGSVSLTGRKLLGPDEPAVYAMHSGTIHLSKTPCPAHTYASVWDEEDGRNQVESNVFGARPSNERRAQRGSVGSSPRYVDRHGSQVT